MSATAEFVSAIGPAIERHVALKRALGQRFDAQRSLLLQFDRFLAARRAADLTEEGFSAWSSSLERVSASGRRLRMQVVHRFCLYRRRSEPGCFVPDPSQFPPPQPKIRPHVFSEDEIVRLLRAADSRHGARQVARLALVLLYTSGLRRGELVRLTLGDYDSARRVLLVRDSKFHKSRIVPLSPDAARETERYVEYRRRRGFPRRADAPLLIHRRGDGVSAYSGAGLHQLMRRVYRAAGVRTAAGRPPRVHDLRFTFAVHALSRWYRAGADVQTKLPSLAIYMGHVSVASTQYYLSCLDDVAQQASDRFERHCARFLPAAPHERGDR